MDEAMWQDAIDSLVRENSKLVQQITLLEDTNHVLSAECKRLSEDLARTYV